MEILTVNTGNEKLDEAYNRMQMHISGFETFESFYQYFQKTVTIDDPKKLNVWLLMVLYIEFRQGRTEVKKHDFDVLLEKVKPDKAEQLKQWLENSLLSAGGTK